MQPSHAVEDRDVADTHWADRLDRAFPYRALAAAGATLEMGSDAPVARLDPWHTIRSAVTRTDDDRPAWHPEQSLTLAEALAASTGGLLHPAVGDPADLILVDRDPADLDPAGLDDIQVLATLVAGRITHRHTLTPPCEDQLGRRGSSRQLLFTSFPKRGVDPRSEAWRRTKRYQRAGVPLLPALTRSVGS